ncbi:MAG: hypothetical protein IPO63_05180 [Bacteroidetes bacterium]|nr:hypothetical protein [Bacteroidota bacterium]
MLYLMPQFKWLKIQLLLGLLLMVGPLSAQQNFLEIPVKLDIEKGNMSEVIVKVKKDGKDAFTQSGASKMRFKLDFNKKYTLIFSKPGYISKTIEVNTKAPAGRISSGFDPYKIGVKLFLQNQENMVIYNQAVAQIKYDQNLDEFNFETDYSKSILSSVTRDETEEDQVEDTASVASTSPSTQSGSDESVAPVTASTSTTNGDVQENANTGAATETNPSIAANHQANEELPPSGKTNTGNEPPPSGTVNTGAEQPNKGSVNGGETPPPTRKGNGDQDQLNAPTYTADKDAKGGGILPATGSENNAPNISVNSSAEAPGDGPQYSESENITREDIVERNRIITKIKVTKNGVETEYSRVNYSWGGRYFFKNNVMSISETLFVQWTGVRN